MSLARRKRRELKRTGKADAGRIITIINKFIEAKYMMVDTNNYHVTMLDELWEMYKGQMLNNFLDNIKLYCSIMNAYSDNGYADPDSVLLISIKDFADGSVEPKYYYKSGTITNCDLE